MKSTRGTPCLLLALALGAPALAHHSIVGEFDVGAEVAVSGKVTEVEWYNPHIWIQFEAVDEDGSTADWQCEMGGPNRLLRRGWRKEDLPLGTVVHVVGNPARDGSNTCNARRVTLDDGRLMFAGDNNRDTR